MGIGRCKGICDSHRIPKTKYHTHNYWILEIEG